MQNTKNDLCFIYVRDIDHDNRMNCPNETSAEDLAYLKGVLSSHAFDGLDHGTKCWSVECAAEAGHMGCVKYFIEQCNVPVSVDIALHALVDCNVDIVCYLLRRSLPVEELERALGRSEQASKDAGFPCALPLLGKQ